LFEFQLAAHLGFPHPDQMKRVLTHRQIVEWKAACRVDPWTQERADYRAAIIAWTLACINTPKGKPRPKVSQFMAVQANKPRRQSVTEQAAVFSQFAAAHNAFQQQHRNKKGK